MKTLHRKSIMKMKNRASAFILYAHAIFIWTKINIKKNNPKNERKKEGKQKEEETQSTQYVFCMLHTGIQKK